MKTISIPVYNRADYLRLTLDSLKRCGDWSDYRLYISVEFGAPEAVVELCRNVDWIDTVVNLAPIRLGCDRNTFRSLNLPFESGSDFNIYWEDDLEASPSLKKLADWYYERNDQTYACMCFESYADRNGPTNEVLRFKSFNPHGSCMRKWQFEEHFKPNWLNHKLSENTKHGWDWNMGNYLIHQNPKTVVMFPRWAHSHHIGVVGTYCTDKIYKHQGQDKLVLVGDVTEPYFFTENAL